MVASTPHTGVSFRDLEEGEPEPPSARVTVGFSLLLDGRTEEPPATSPAALIPVGVNVGRICVTLRYHAGRVLEKAMQVFLRFLPMCVGAAWRNEVDDYNEFYSDKLTAATTSADCSMTTADVVCSLL